MNTEKILAELAAKYGIILNRQDPMFAAVLLNKLILNEYIDEIEVHLTESITNVAIKEDVTVNKLRKLIEDKQIKDRREIEKILNKFADNLQGRLQSIINQPAVDNKSAHWLWVISALLFGLLLGGFVVKIF